MACFLRWCSCFERRVSRVLLQQVLGVFRISLFKLFSFVFPYLFGILIPRYSLALSGGSDSGFYLIPSMLGKYPVRRRNGFQWITVALFKGFKVRRGWRSYYWRRGTKKKWECTRTLVRKWFKASSLWLGLSLLYQKTPTSTKAPSFSCSQSVLMKRHESNMGNVCVDRKLACLFMWLNGFWTTKSDSWWWFMLVTSFLMMTYAGYQLDDDLCWLPASCMMMNDDSSTGNGTDLTTTNSILWYNLPWLNKLHG